MRQDGTDTEKAVGTLTSAGSSTLYEAGSFKNGSFGLTSVRGAYANYSFSFTSMVFDAGATYSSTTERTETNSGLETVALECYTSLLMTLDESGRFGGDSYSFAIFSATINPQQTVSAEIDTTLNRSGFETDALSTATANTSGANPTAGYLETVSSANESDLSSYAKTSQQTLTLDSAASMTLTRLGSFDQAGYSFNTVTYRAQESRTSTSQESSTTGLDGTVVKARTAGGIRVSNDGGGADNSTFNVSTDERLAGVFRRRELDETSSTSHHSYSLYQAGKVVGGGYAFSSISYDDDSSVSSFAGQTRTGLETGNLASAETVTPAGSGAGTTTNSPVRVTSSSGTYSKDETEILTTSGLSTFSLHEEGVYANGCYSLSSFVQTELDENSVSLSRERGSGATITAHIVQRTNRASALGSTVNMSSSGTADFTATLTDAATFSLEVDSDLAYSDHQEGTLDGGTFNLSCLVFDLEAGGTQSTSVRTSESAVATGTRTGTFSLGAGASFQGSGSFTNNANASTSVNESRSFGLSVYGAGQAANWSLNLSCYSFQATSAECLSYTAASDGTSLMTGTTAGGGGFNGNSTDRVREEVSHSYSSGLTERGSSSTNGGYRLDTTLSVAGEGAFTFSRSSLQSWSGDSGGNTSFSATATGKGGVALEARGSYSNGSYGFTDYRLHGGSSGTFSQLEIGTLGDVNFRHSRDWTGTQTVDKEGSYTGGNFSFTSFDAHTSGLETIGDMVGTDGQGRIQFTDNRTTGTGNTGVMTDYSFTTVVSTGAATQTSVSGPYSTSMPLNSSLAGLERPEQRINPWGYTAGMRTEGAPLFGVSDALPEGALALPLSITQVGPDSGWWLRLGGGGLGQQVGLVLTGPQTSRVETLFAGGPEACLYGYYGPMQWSWFGPATLGIWGEVGGTYADAWWRWPGAQPVADPLAVPAPSASNSLAQAQKMQYEIHQAFFDPVVVVGFVYPNPVSAMRLIQNTNALFAKYNVPAQRRGPKPEENPWDQDFLGTFDRAMMHRNWVEATGGRQPPLASGSLPVYGLDGHQNAAGAMVQVGQLTVQILRPALLPFYFTPVAPIAALGSAGVDVLRGDYIGAALDLLGPLAFRGASALGRAIGVSGWPLAGRLAFNATSGFLIGASVDYLSQLNAIARGEQNGYNPGQTLLAGITAGIMNALFAETCFTGETKIYARGAWGEGWRRIDRITTADEVLARDEHDPTGPLKWKRVEEVFVRTARVWNLHVGGQIIGTTVKHRFYEAARGWTSASHLRINDRLVGIDPEATTSLRGVADSGRSALVYNVCVADCHTYFVGDDSWGLTVWAHNAGRLGCGFDLNDPNLSVRSRRELNRFLRSHTGSSKHHPVFRYILRGIAKANIPIRGRNGNMPRQNLVRLSNNEHRELHALWDTLYPHLRNGEGASRRVQQAIRSGLHSPQDILRMLEAFYRGGYSRSNPALAGDLISTVRQVRMNLLRNIRNATAPRLF